MKFREGTLKPFAKYCLYSGLFTVISFVFFSMVYHFVTPEVATFASAAKANTLAGWFHSNFLTLGEGCWFVLFVVAAIVSAALGFATGIVAKVLNDKAADALKEGIET